MPGSICTQIVYTLGLVYLYREYFKAKVYTVWVITWTLTLNFARRSLFKGSFEGTVKRSIGCQKRLL